MRQLFFLLLMIVSFYVAGMYSSRPLLILAVSEALLFLCMFFLPFLFRGKVSFGFKVRKGMVYKGENCLCGGNIYNSGKFPISRIKIRIISGYRGEKKTRRKSLYAGALPGENEVSFFMSAGYCGIVKVRVEKMTVYDYLGLFFVEAKKRKEEKYLGEMEVYVFPVNGIREEEKEDARGMMDGENPEISIQYAADTYGEVRQLREYLPQDGLRNIHWKQSARMGDIWVKEYEKEADVWTLLLLDVDTKEADNTRIMDCFYERLSGFVTGRLKEAQTVLVFWYSERLEQMTQVMLKENEDLRGMFVELYQNTLCMEAENKDKRENALKEWMAFHDGYFRLTGKLELYFGTTLLKRYEMS